MTQIRLLAILTVLVLLLASCSEQQAAPPPRGRPPSPVRVATVLTQEVQRSVSLVGTVEPWRRSVVASEIAGLVEVFSGGRRHGGEKRVRSLPDFEPIPWISD